MSSAELDFYRTERPRLAAIGITDYHAQSLELANRWLWLKNSSAPAQSTTNDGTVTFSEKLSKADEKSMNLVLLSSHTGPLGSSFVYGLQPDADDADSRPAKRGRMADLRDVSAMAVLTRAKKDTLQALCEDLELPVSGNKDELVGRIVHSMMCVRL